MTHELMSGVTEIVLNAPGQFHVAADAFDVGKEFDKTALARGFAPEVSPCPVPPLLGPCGYLGGLGQAVDLGPQVAVMSPHRGGEIHCAPERRFVLVVARRQGGKRRTKDEPAANADPFPGAPIVDDLMVAHRRSLARAERRANVKEKKWRRLLAHRLPLQNAPRAAPYPSSPPIYCIRRGCLLYRQKMPLFGERMGFMRFLVSIFCQIKEAQELFLHTFGLCYLTHSALGTNDRFPSYIGI